MSPKLVVIRGPSGAGKSTVAARLFLEATRPTALVDLDYCRQMFRNRASDEVMVEYDVAKAAIEISIEQGFNVIFDGNFRLRDGGRLPLPLFSFPGATTFVFYLDVSLPETLRRHVNRNDQRLTVEGMKRLYRFAQPLGAYPETVIPEGSSLDETLSTIRRVADI